MNEKKTYNTPLLTVHGNVESLTQIGGFVNPSDIPHGHPLLLPFSNIPKPKS
jgi:hypothetical protein